MPRRWLSCRPRGVATWGAARHVSAVPAGACERHSLARAHSPMPSRGGTLVYLTCGVCGVRCVTTAGLWQAEVERRRTPAGTAAPEEA